MIIDAEAIIQGRDGVTDFEALHRRSRNAYVFDLLMLDEADLRGKHVRRKELERIFRRCKSGLVLNFAIRPRLGGIQSGLPHGPRGDCVEANRCAVSVGQVINMA
jgi:hypothetical protein